MSFWGGKKRRASRWFRKAVELFVHRSSSIINAKDEIGRWVPQLKGLAKVNPLVTKVRETKEKHRRRIAKGVDADEHGYHMMCNDCLPPGRISTWDLDNGLPLMPNSSGRQSRLRRLSFCGQRHGNHPEPKVRRQDPPSKSTLIIFNQFHYPALAALVRRRPA
ncbi:hypothetical protein BDV41DRAFT_568822 [Aspergillus transmontanensis]|uniref:Uncharacterized protein n=1 Tax=Aspergillus transmontanensis TaxID=1034304 RepID=A0A5N6VKM9_9EURO|nr:hypothetical protein BDV41DRAFT_568822 [Aspergillus transmontanensis]